MHPCQYCPYKDGDDFCKLLPWNDTTLLTPLDKYIAWQGKPCPYANEPRQLTLPIPRRKEK